MLEQGFLDEVRALYKRSDLHLNLPSMRCVGYRQAWEHLDGKYSYEEMRERGIIATRQLAKRQITWLRSWPDLHWLDSEDTNILRSEEHTSELQSRPHLVCRLLLEKKNKIQ